MSEISTASDRPLGILLLQAGLISERQLKIALAEQEHDQQDCIGEILVSHGWLKQQSVDYFTEEWPQLKNRTSPQRLGQCLEQAALLSRTQVESILEFQQYTQYKFGALAILNGWVKRRTINFFLRYLSHKNPSLVDSKTALLREKLLENETVNPFALLLLYQQILQQRSVKANKHPTQSELLEMGLVVADKNRLKIAEGLDPSLLDLQWVTQQLNTLQPYHWIRIKLFKLAEHSDYPYRTLAAILAWTNEQGDLTHKLGLLIHQTKTFITGGEEEAQVASLVQSHIIHNWHSGIAAEHLHKIEKGLVRDLHADSSASHLLMLYQRILEQPEVKIADSPSSEAEELLKLGLIINCDGVLRVANRIYEFVFSHHWVAQQRGETLPTSAEKVLLPPNGIPTATTAAIEFSEPISAQSGSDAAPLTTEVTVHQLSQDSHSPRQVNTYASSEVRAKPSPHLPAGNASNVTIVIAQEPNRTVVRLLLFAAIAGILTTIGIQHWRQSTSINPVTSTPIPQQDLNTTAISPSLPINAEALSSAPALNPSLEKLTPLQAEQNKTDSDSQAKASSSGPIVIRSTNSNIKVPIFRTGSTLEQITETLGEPTWNRRGYYSNSRALLYEGFVPNQVDLGYLVSTTTGKLRQTESSFAQSVPLEILQNTLIQTLNGNVPPDVQEKLRQIYRRQADQHDFSVGNLEGNIHRQPEGWIYIGIWDSDFH